VTYLRNKLGAGGYWAVNDQVVFSLTGEAGVMNGLGNRIRINDRFFLGGDSFKGFATGGVGPRDENTRDALGGRRFYVGTAELSFPLGFPDELGVSGKAFTTVGSVWDANEDGEPFVSDVSDARASVGIGAAWKSPFGPIRVDLARAILKQEVDQTQTFHFSFGTRF